jgi:uncharacterized repeat protein (TIGR01451 family)
MLMDAGGDGAYPDVSSQLTLCPDAAGLRSQIFFTEFDLEPGFDGFEGHKLYVFDGPDTGSPLFGIFETTSLAGLTLSATNTNISGCLLLLFDAEISNNQGHTGWSAQASCVEPCTPPSISITSNATSQDEGILLYCNGDVVELDASGSNAAPGHSISSYIFNFDDGSPIETTAAVIHSYTYPHVFEVTLTVIDDIGCTADTVFPVGMLAPAQISLPNIDAICLGGDSLLVAEYAVQTISNAPQSSNNEPVFLVDGAGFGYTSTILVEGFDAGSTITSCDQFNSIMVNMEHSFMGDLSIALECPNGTLVSLVSFGINGGGNTFLGQPLDDDSAEPGIGLDYGWTPESLNGTFGQNSAQANNNTITVNEPTPGTSLAPGIYSSQEDLCNFVGCPYNGAWTLMITDNIGLDNGYLFNWSIELEGNLNGSSPISYTPTIDEGISGSLWSGGAIQTISADGDSITLDTNIEGLAQLTYTTIDNIGCATTESIEVNITNNFFDIVLAETYIYDPATYPQLPYLNAYLADWTIPVGAQWEWWPADGLQSVNTAFTYLMVPNENEFYVVTVEHPSFPGCSSSDTIDVVLPDIQIGGFIFLDSNQNGVFDSDEQALPNFPYTIANNQYSSFSDQTGAYFAFPMNSGNSITILVDNDLWIPTTSTSYTYDISSGETIFTYNFGVIPGGTPTTIVDGFISIPSALCIINNTQIISILNQGNTQPSGYAVYTFDPLCAFVSATPEPDSISGNQLFFDYGPLNFGAVSNFNVTLDMPNTALPGDSIWFNLQTYYFNGVDTLAANTDPITTPILCSYDPNDIRELNGIGPEGRIAPNTTLDYVIRFENMGTAPAYDVVIVDQLPDEVDPTTIVPVSASHNYHMIVNALGALTIEFNDINLPAEAEDSLLNQGYIHFRIDQDPDLAIGTQFTNSASIYFDYNEPIHTNEAITTIYACPQTELMMVVNDNTLEVLDAVTSVEWYLDGVLLAESTTMLEAEVSGMYQAIGTTALGCVLTSEVFNVTVTNHIATVSSMPRLFPNPSRGDVNLRAASEWLGCDLRIINSMGALVYTGVISQEQTTLPTELWASGLYNIMLIRGNKEASLHFVKQ